MFKPYTKKLRKQIYGEGLLTIKGNKKEVFGKNWINDCSRYLKTEEGQDGLTLFEKTVITILVEKRKQSYFPRHFTLQLFFDEMKIELEQFNKLFLSLQSNNLISLVINILGKLMTFTVNSSYYLEIKKKMRNNRK